MYLLICEDLSQNYKRDNNTAKTLSRKIRKFDFVLFFYMTYDIVAILANLNAYSQNPDLDVFKFFKKYSDSVQLL